ncbi:MAG: RES family NAD+ phosphorylase [Longimicrobiales bacterium]
MRRLRLAAWRVVESQHQISTRKLVASDAEQQLLEQMIEQAKPPNVSPASLHYLLSTPFRYPPLRHGSRFGVRTEPGIWYGSEAVRGAFAEVAYYRLVFLEGTRADLGVLETELSAFSVPIDAQHGIDLTVLPFAIHEETLASPVKYEETQALGRAMREAGVEAFRYVSARAVLGGVNVGVIKAGAFARSQPERLETWHCVATRQGVEFLRRDYFQRATHTFPRLDFLVSGLLPSPAV